VESDIAGWTAAGAERGVVTGYWILDTRYWILVTASAEHEAGYWILDTGYWSLRVRSTKQDTGCQIERLQNWVHLNKSSQGFKPVCFLNAVEKCEIEE